MFRLTTRESYTACGKAPPMQAYIVLTQGLLSKPDGQTMLASYRGKISGVSGYTEENIYINYSIACFHIFDIANGEKTL